MVIITSYLKSFLIFLTLVTAGFSLEGEAASELNITFTLQPKSSTADSSK